MAYIYRYGEKDLGNLRRVLNSGDLGARDQGMVGAFERQVAGIYGVKEAIAANAAMSLLHASINAAGAGIDDEVICDPIVQFGAVASMYNNAFPVFADVDAETLNIDPKQIESRITERTKAVVVTHLWGYPAPVDEIREICDKRHIYLIEDCAHAQLAMYRGRYLGNYGHIGIFSFNHGKQLSTGDGAVAICNDPEFARKVRAMLIFGESPPSLAWNYRMNETTAAVASAQYECLPDYMPQYRRNLELYDEALDDTPWLAKRRVLDGGERVGYWYSRIFRGEQYGIDYDAFKSVAAEFDDVIIDFGFTQLPAYEYPVFQVPYAYANKGCPTKPPYYNGRFKYEKGIKGFCPVAEDVIPRLVYATATIDNESTAQNALRWRQIVEETEKRSKV